MLRTMLVAAAVLGLSFGHWSGGSGGSSWGGSSGWGGGGGSGQWGGRENGGYCRDRMGYLYRCGDSSWGSGSRWNNYYGSGGYYDQARYVGRGRVNRGSGNNVQLVCDFRRDGRLSYGETIESVVWRKVRSSGWSGGCGSYRSSRASSNYHSNRNCGGWGGRPGVVAGWVTTDRDVSTLTLLDPRPYDYGRYRCMAQVRGRSIYGRPRNLVYMEVDFSGNGGWGTGNWGTGNWGSGNWGTGNWGGNWGNGNWGNGNWGNSGWGNSGWGNGGWGNTGSWGGSGWGSGTTGSIGWGSPGGSNSWWYSRSALKKTKPDRVVEGEGSRTSESAGTRLSTDRKA